MSRYSKIGSDSQGPIVKVRAKDSNAVIGKIKKWQNLFVPVAPNGEQLAACSTRNAACDDLQAYFDFNNS